MPAIRTASFTESVIREMTRVAQQHGAINLAQGFPDFPMPEAMKEAACAAIQGDINALKSINAYQVGGLRYYDPSQAGGRFGIKAGTNGAIEVIMKTP